MHVKWCANCRTEDWKLQQPIPKGCWLNTMRSGNILPWQYVAIIHDILSLIPFSIPSGLSISSFPTEILSGMLFSMWCLVHCNLSDFTNSIWHSEDCAFWYILIMKAKKMHCFSDLFDKVIYMFQTCPLSIIRSISTLYTHNRYLSF